MSPLLRVIVVALAGLPALAVAWLALARIVRQIYPFPMPHFLAGLIDNPVRRRFFHPPDEMPQRHGLEPGMTALEIGPGSGTYTVATARYLGESGRLVTVDIEPKMIERVRRRLQKEGVANVEARVADAYHLPYKDGTFDAAYLIAVIGEIPDPDRAIREIRRVLKPSGTLALSELLPDPDSPLAASLTRRVTASGFKLRHKVGGWFAYSLLFDRDPAFVPGKAAAGHQQRLTRGRMLRIKRPAKLAYRLGLGPIIGRLVLLLTTTGRKSGLPRITPLQYEEDDGVIYIASARGVKADWYRNLAADPRVTVRIGSRQFTGTAETSTDPTRIADLLELRLARHPRIVGAIMKADGIPMPPTRQQLEAFAASIAMVTIRPDEPLTKE